MTRWQRERRQQAVIVVVFTAILVFVLGLVAWAASDRYYRDNLAAVASVSGTQIPQRELNAERAFQLVRFQYTYGLSSPSLKDPQMASFAASLTSSALDALVEQSVLDQAAREQGIAPTPEQIDGQYAVEYGQFRVRHVLIEPAAGATDTSKADAEAKAKAQAVAEQLRADPKNDELWKKVAAESSADPGSKDRGGELGWADTGSYVPEFEDAIRTLGVGQVSDPVRTQFGYHVIQVEEKRTPAESELVKAYKQSGYGEADLKLRARYAVLRQEFTRRQTAADPSGSAEQVRLAKIVINVPSLTSGDYQTFAAALDKQKKVEEALAQGKDFAEIAKQSSEDSATAAKGGDMGWVTRGVIVDPISEDIVFSTEAGKVTRPVGTTTQWTVYKVLEKETRPVTDAQLALQRDNAYQYWLVRQKRAYDAKKLLTGYAQD